MAPNKVNAKNESKIRQILATSKTSIKKPLFKIGDYVRLSRGYKGIFSKSYEGNWTEELFKIIKVKNTVPTTYEIENIYGEVIKGSFYEKELQKTLIEDYFRIEKVLGRRTNADGSVDIKVTKKGYDQRHFYWIPLEETQKL
jgi:hypothetical protein